MALGDKHATLSFSGWPWAPDARKRGILETPVAPRHGEIIFFASPGPPAQENLALLMAISSQRREKAVQNLFKRLPKTEPGHKKHRLSQILLSSSILNVFWTGFRRQRYQEYAPTCLKNKTVFEARSKGENCVSTAPARAD